LHLKVVYFLSISLKNVSQTVMRSSNTKCTNELTKRPIRVLRFTNDWIQHFNKTKNICSLPQRQSNIEYLQPKTKFDKLELKIYNVVDELMWLKWLEYMAKHIFKNPNNTTNIFYTVRPPWINNYCESMSHLSNKNEMYLTNVAL
jgi:hypothetical protein